DAKGVTFDTFADLDLWLSARSCTYSMTINSKNYVYEKSKYYDYKLIEYSVTVKVWDTYDFNTGTEIKDAFSWLNNFGYIVGEKGYGKEFDWCVTYTQIISIDCGASYPCY
ncbi:MAG: hypothetical protein IJX02_03855, partial [Clostridia bacterium]|nr:hypothetical protein [Clostridia bacterium]